MKSQSEQTDEPASSLGLKIQPNGHKKRFKRSAQTVFFARHENENNTQLKERSAPTTRTKLSLGQSDHPNNICQVRVGPSTPSNASENDVREVANVRQHEMANNRVHRRLPARNTGRRNTERHSRDRAAANGSTKSMASWLHRPSVSIATTTRRHRSLSTKSWYLLSFSVLGRTLLRPLGLRWCLARSSRCQSATKGQVDGQRGPVVLLVFRSGIVSRQTCVPPHFRTQARKCSGHVVPGWCKFSLSKGTILAETPDHLVTKERVR